MTVPPRSWWRLAVALLLPVLVAVGFLTLIALDLNGSSLGSLRIGSPDPALVAGTPRMVRSDEWAIQTPLSIRAVREGLPDSSYIGLTRTQQPAVTLGGPTSSWIEAFRPQNWGYLALGPSRGLAWHWWFGFLVALVGIYALVLWLTRAVVLSVVLAVIGAFSPYTAWWSAPSTALLLGFASLTATALLIALGGCARRRLLAGAAGGVAAVCLAMTLYPPWQVSLALVVVALVLGRVIDLRIPLARLALPAASFSVTAVVPLSFWWWQNQETIALTAQTIYPGERRSSGGTANLSWLLDAPLNWWLTGQAGQDAAAAIPALFRNQSESSASWFPLPVVAALLAVVLYRAWRGRRRTGGDQILWTTIGVSAIAALLLVWAIVPIPSGIGQVLLLDRVPGRRLPLALGFVALLAVVLAAVSYQDRRWGRRIWTVLGAAAVVSVATTLWAREDLPWAVDHVPFWGAAASGLVVAVGFCLLPLRSGWRAAVGMALAVSCFASWAIVNPLYRGLGPYDDDPLVVAVREETDGQPTRAAAFGSRWLSSLLNGAGAETLSSTTFIPNTPLMTRYWPGRDELWNNYNSYVWVPAVGHAEPSILPITFTWISLGVAPCSSFVRSLEPQLIVSQSPLTGPCLEPVDDVESAVGLVHLYRVSEG